MRRRKPSTSDTASATMTVTAELPAARSNAEQKPVEQAAEAFEDPGLAKTEVDLSATPEPTPFDETLPGVNDPKKRKLPIELVERFVEPQMIGAGGMGTVFKAHDQILARDIALKLLHSGNSQLDEKLFREARSQAKLTHENVCKVFEVGSIGEHRFLVMQLITGKTLDDAKSSMTLEQKVRIIRTIAAALHEVHRQGFIHRDIKPSNIMVEETEDGTYKPYLMDFGLAREVGAQGKTVTGIIAGTPAFMAPEQARGEIRQLDRRTDVYSLGATLYDLLAGKPPFVSEDVWQLLMDLQIKEPTHLRTVDKTIPGDVAAIVMKCLEKEPQHRYESAKALGDDLQRFLDGENVRKASVFFLAYKKAKRNKFAVLGFLGILTASVILVGFWAREKRAAERQAIFSRELGEVIKEMELFLRAAHELPTHDIERDRRIVRNKLAKVQNQMAELGKLGEGPGHYALGRGHLGLQEFETAREHFQQAMAAGYSSPELEYALGLTLGELYRKGLEELKRIENPEKKKARLDQLNAELKEPALRRLSASLGGDLVSVAYVKGLIALYGENYEEAKKYAKEAFEQEPWLYEAKKLEADAFYGEGSKYRHDKAFDYAKMMTFFQPAADAYGEATEIGRSDPQVFLASCEFWRQLLASTPNTYDAARPVFEKGSNVCAQGIKAAPRFTELRTAATQFYQIWSHKLIFSSGAPASDALRYLKEGVAMAEEGAKLRPDDAMAQYTYGAALLNKVYYENDRGLDSLPAIMGAIDSLTKSAKLDSSFLWAHNEACKAYANQVRRLSSLGQDTQSALNGAIDACDRAIKLEPTWAFPYIGKAQAYLYRALDEMQYGAGQESSFDKIFKELDEAKKHNAKHMAIPGIKAKGYYYRALLEISGTRDPDEFLARADGAIDELRAINPTTSSIGSNSGLVAGARARRALQIGKDPSAFIATARDALEQTSKLAPWDIDFRVHRAGIEITALSWALMQRKATKAMFDEALAPLEAMLSEARFLPDFYQKIAEMYSLQARWLRAEKKDADEAVKRGMEMADKALAIHPRMAAALVTKGLLLTLQSLSTKDEKKRKQSEDAAQVAFDTARKENKLVEPELTNTLKTILADK